MAVTVRAVRASNGARDWPREVAGQADHLQPCCDRGRLRRWTASERRSRRRFNLVAKGLILQLSFPFKKSDQDSAFSVEGSPT